MLRTKPQNKWYTVSTLLEAMKGAGLWSSKEQILSLEKQGKLTLPRSPNVRKDRMVNESMIIGIMKAFSPGGKGYYHYTKQTK